MYAMNVFLLNMFVFQASQDVRKKITIVQLFLVILKSFVLEHIHIKTVNLIRFLCIYLMSHI